MLLKRWTFLFMIFVIFLSAYSFLMFGEEEEEPKEEIAMTTQPGEILGGVEQLETIPVPEKGLHQLIGKTEEELIAELGEPERKDVSGFGYDWWIYKDKPEKYMQVGVEKGKVVTIYGIGQDLSIAPFKIGQKIADIQRIVPMESKKTLEVNGNSYQFELSEEEMQLLPLFQLGDVWVQLYIDKFEQTLSSIRYMTPETLVKQRPYELVYIGELISVTEPTEEEWRKIEKGKASQILDLTNIIRSRYGLNNVEWHEETAEVAYSHSEEMYTEKFFSHESAKQGGLADRLTKAGVLFDKAGENIAAQYIDAPAAVEGWLNSKGHRETLLSKDFTHLGVGVYHRYYTQNFIQELK